MHTHKHMYKKIFSLCKKNKQKKPISATSFSGP